MTQQPRTTGVRRGLALLLCLLLTFNLGGITALAAGDETPRGGSGITVYFIDAKDWGQPCVYFWGSAQSVDWPGLAMTECGTDNGKKVFRADIPADVTGILFNIGENFTQTDDITTGIEDGAVWYPTGEFNDNHQCDVLRKVYDYALTNHINCRTGSGTGYFYYSGHFYKAELSGINTAETSSVMLGVDRDTGRLFAIRNAEMLNSLTLNADAALGTVWSASSITGLTPGQSSSGYTNNSSLAAGGGSSGKKICTITCVAANEPTWSWSADYTACTAAFTCADKPDLTASVSAAVTSSGINITASVTFNGTVYSDTQRVCTVSFDSNGHSTAPAPQTVLYGGKATQPFLPEISGYRFDGWYTDAACTGPFDFDTPITSDLTLYARWTPRVFTILYNDGWGNTTESTYTVESPDIILPQPTHTGYTFCGWFDVYTGEQVTVIPTGRAGNRWFKATWTPNTYTVIFDGNGATDGSMSDQQLTYNREDPLTANAFTRTGYTFAGWNTRPDGSGTAYYNSQGWPNVTAEPNGVVTLYAQWTINRYAVSFNANGHGSDPAGQTVDYNGCAVQPELEAEGYLVYGWYREPSCETPWSFDEDRVTENVTLYAGWTKLYTVDYELDGGTNAAENPASYTALAGFTLSEPTRTGHAFIGWTWGDVTEPALSVTIPEGSSGDLTFTAHWRVHTYTVAFDANAEGVSGEMADQLFPYDQARELNACAFSRTGYTFEGWSTAADGSGERYADGQELLGLTAEDGAVVTFYAQWRAHRYTVAFEANAEEVSGETADQSFTYDTAQKLTACGFTRTGYDFKGWSDTENGSAVYEDKQTVTNLTAEDGALVTLYAVWKTHNYYVNPQDEDFPGRFSLEVNGAAAECAHYGDTVIVTVLPNEGYAVKENSFAAFCSGEALTVTPVEGTTDQYAFVMPAGHVYATAEFRRDVAFGMNVYLDGKLADDEPIFLYTGEPITPAVLVEDYISNVPLAEGSDYTVSLSDDNIGSEGETTEVTVTITGTGDYYGARTETFRIADCYDIADCEIKGTLEAYFDGYQAAVLEGIEVWYGDDQLTRDVDYYVDVEYVPEYVVGQTYPATVYGTGDWGGEKSFKVTFVQLHHPVVFESGGGTGTMDGARTTTDYQFGEVYDLPDCGFTAPYGMRFSYWKVSYEEYGETCESEPMQPGETFDAPNIWLESDLKTITVTAYWRELTESEMVTLTASGMEHGSLLLNGEPAELTDGALSLFEYGKITVLPKSGYAINSVSYNDGSDHTVTPDAEGAYTFTMPERDVTLTAAFDYLLATAPTITAQPTDVTSTYGTPAGELTVEASGLEGQPLTYQWYACDDLDGTNAQAIDGAADASYTLPDGRDAGTTDYYFCVVTATREDNGMSADTATDVAAVTVEKADFYPERLPDLMQYVPGNKAGSVTLALPPLPEGASYHFILFDEDGVVGTLPESCEENKLSFTNNSGKTAGTTATICVTASGAPNYNDYGFNVIVTVSEYTVEYAWPEQTNIWLDADNELVWSEDVITLDESLITVMKDGAPVTDFDFAVEGNGEVMEPGPNRIRVTGEGLDDWVDFTVIELIEDDPGLILDIPDWTYPDVAISWNPPVWTTIVGSLTYGGNTLELSKDDISRGGGVDDGSLKLWYENADRPDGFSGGFLYRELTVDKFCNVEEATYGITPFGSVELVGDRLVYLPNHVTVQQLLDDSGNPVTAGNGGSIYYMCARRPDLHAEQSDNGEWALWNGDAPVPEDYFFRNGKDFYYGTGEDAYTVYGGEEGFISFWPVKSYAYGKVYDMGDKPVTQILNHINEEGEPVYSPGTLACGFFRVNLDPRDTLYIGKNYVYSKSGGSAGFLYTGDITPVVADGELWLGEYHIPLNEDNYKIAVACMPDDAIDGDLAGDEIFLPHAYARYKVDDYRYQIADQEFHIFPNNSLIQITGVQAEYPAGGEAVVSLKLLQNERGMSAFVNGELYERIEGWGKHTLTIKDLQEGTYVVSFFGDGDDYVTSYENEVSFTVVPNIITVMQEPEDVSVPLGETAVTTVIAEGRELTYQWYYRDAGAETWSESIYTGDTYTLIMKGTRNGREVYCVITDAEGHTSTTRTATLTIELPADYVSPAITRDAVNCFVGPGEKPSVTVEATGYGELSYQWYYCNAGAETWNKSSIRTGTYACAMNPNRHERQIYCVVSDAYGGKAQSKTVTIGFDLPTGYDGPTFTQQPSDSFVDVGGMTDVTVAAEGVGDVTYQWYYKDAGTEKWIKSSLQGESYAVYMKISRDGRQVCCEATDACGFTAVSEPATIGYAYPNGYEKPSVTALTGDVSVGPGEQAITTVEAAGDGELSCQWYYRDAGAVKWTRSIYTGYSYILNMRANRDGRQVYCVVTDRYGAKAESEPVTLRMTVTEDYKGPTIRTEPQDASAPEGQMAVVTVAAEGEGELTYQWYYRNAGAEKWSKSVYTGVSYSLIMSAERNGREVYCVVTDRYGYTVTSRVATLTLGQ